MRWNNDKISFNFFLSIIPVNFVFDFLYYMAGSQSFISLVRVAYDILFVLFIFFTNKQVLAPRFRLLYFMLIYWAVLILFSSDKYASVMEYMKVALSLSFFPIAFAMIDTFPKFIRFQKSVLYCLVIYIILVVLSNKFNIGDTSYEREDEAFKTALGDAKLYPPAFLVGLLPFFIKQKLVFRRMFWIVAGIANFSLLVLTLRRTTLLIISLLIVLFFTYSGKFAQLVKFGVIAAVMLVLTLPLYQETLQKRLEFRSNVYSEDYSVTQEGRYMELGYVLDNFENGYHPVLLYIFGKEAFNTINNYGFYRPRPIHVDYTYLFFSSGLFGLLLYVAFIVRIKQMGSFYQSKLRDVVSRDYFAMFQAVFFVFVLVGFSGNVWAITYRVYIFALMGSFLGLFHHLYETKGIFVPYGAEEQEPEHQPIIQQPNLSY